MFLSQNERLNKESLRQRFILGSIIYAVTTTRPDLAVAVGIKIMDLLETRCEVDQG